MYVCLIVPPSPFLLDERSHIHIGLLRVAAVLQQAEHRVEVVDLSGISNYQEVLEVYLQEHSPDVFGITTTSPQIRAVMQIARTIRARSDRRLILGGAHPTFVHAAAKRNPQRAEGPLKEMLDVFDVLVVGDGEAAILAALTTEKRILDADHDPDLFLSSEQYSDAPLPARHLLDLDSYQYHIDGYRAGNLVAQLGCPFACGFCGGRSVPSKRRIRERTIESVLQEVELMYRHYGYTGFMFHDDEINLKPGCLDLFNGLHDLQRRLGVDFRVRAFVKSQLLTEAQAEAMYRAGFRWLLVGFESGDPRILENMQKAATQQQNTRCLQIAKQHGLKTKALMTVGHPGESRETLMTTRDWIIESQPEEIDFTVVTVYPGCPYYDEAVANPELGEDVWTYTFRRNGDRLHMHDINFTHNESYYKQGKEGGYRSYVFTDHLSCEDVVSLREHLEQYVRTELGLPFNIPTRAAINYEHSMGSLPSYVLNNPA